MLLQTHLHGMPLHAAPGTTLPTPQSHRVRTPFRWHGNYTYTPHLLALDLCRPVNQVKLPTFLLQVTTPLIANRWKESLQDHADWNFANYITSGIQHGFRVGYQYARYRHHSARSNMPLALANSEVVQEYIMHEVQAGRVLGPIDPNSIPEFQISRSGVIPKSAQPGHWRLILDLNFSSQTLQHQQWY